MKRVLSIFTILSILSVFMLPFTTSAYTGGLIQGVTMNVGTNSDPYSTAGGTTANATDGDHQTSVPMSDKKILWYELPSEKTISRYYASGSHYTNNYMKFRFYNAAGTLLTTISASDSTYLSMTVPRSITPINGVKKVAVVYEGTLGGGQINEFDVFDETYVVPLTAGLLRGKAYYTNGTVTNGANVIDGNLSTKADITKDSQIQFYDAWGFNQPKTIASIYAKGTGTWKYVLLDHSGNFVSPGWQNIDVSGDSYLTVNKTNIRGLYLMPSTAGTLNEVEMYETTPKEVPSAPPPPDTTPPDTPTGFNATAGNSSVNLSWNAVTASDLQGYNIYQNGSKIAGPITATTYTVSGLTNDTEYSFSVSSVDNNGNESMKSNSVTSTPFLPKPNVPTGLTAIAQDGSVQLSWNNNSEPDVSYNVYQNGVKINAVPITANHFTVLGLTNETEYSFTITAIFSNGGESAKSAAVTATPLDTTAPTPPTGLTATAGSKEALLQWDINDTDGDFEGFIVYQDGVQIAGPITDNHYTVTNLTNGQQYSFTVSAIDIKGNESAKSSAATVTPFMPVPGAPASLTAELSPDAKAVNLGWQHTPDSHFKAYRVYISTDGDNYTVKGDSATLEASYTDLKEDTKYFFKVTAVNQADEESSASNVAEITTPKRAVEPEQTPTPEYLQLNWESVVGASGYRIQYNSRKIAEVGAEVTTYQITKAQGYNPEGPIHDAKIITLFPDGSEGIINGDHRKFGFTASDIFNNTVMVAFFLSGFFLFGIIIRFLPKLIEMARNAMFGG
jgi:fibronectin type 3 domain-containing protein